jgi:broad specificity phosphatase PhoE
MTTILLVRHGQTEWNRVERFRGQAEATGRRIAAEWRLSAIYSSPLSRAVNTGQAIADHLAESSQVKITVQVIPDLADFDFGDWQGLTPEEAGRRWPEEIKAWYFSPQTVRIPGGETLEDLRARSMRVMRQMIDRHPQDTIAVVSHTDVNRIILLAMLGLGNERFWRLRQDTCAINVIEAEDDVFTLVSMNDTDHLRYIS